MRVLLMGLLLVMLVHLAACSRGPVQTVGSKEPVPVPVLSEDGVDPAPAPRPSLPEPFRFPDDAGGRQVARVLAPASPPAPPLPTADGPRSRSAAPDDRPMPWPPINAGLPAGPLARAKPPQPTPPPEVVPRDLSTSAALDTTAVRMADSPLIRTPAPTLPGAAELPVLGRPVPDRASTADPTVDLAAARIVFTAWPFPGATAAWFLRLGIPDPFELAAHMRGRTGQDGELATIPVTVPPKRP